MSSPLHISGENTKIRLLSSVVQRHNWLFACEYVCVTDSFILIFLTFFWKGRKSMMRRIAKVRHHFWKYSYLRTSPVLTVKTRKFKYGKFWDGLLYIWKTHKLQKHQECNAVIYSHTCKYSFIWKKKIFFQG